MSVWLSLLLAVALAGAVGYLVARRFVSPDARLNPATAFAALILGVIAVGWGALLLAAFGVFGLGTLMAVVLPGAAALLIWPRRPVPPEPDIPPPNGERLARWEWVMLAAWLAVALWLFFRPHETVYGGADAGVYVSLGAEIARNGGFRITDETLAGLTVEMQTAVLRPLPNSPAPSYLLPGFYATNAVGDLTPQFYPLHPVWQAIVFAAAGSGAAGVRAELLLTGVWITLGALAVFWTARDLGGPLVAALALAALSLLGLQVWFGRYPTSEALTQFLLWSGIWSGGRWLDGRAPGRLWAFTAGSAFGAVFLVRIDSLVLLPVFALVLLWRWARGWERTDGWFAVPFVLLVIHSLLHGHFLSTPYFYETVGYGVFLLTRLWLLAVAAAVVGAAGLWWLARRPGRLRAPERWRRPVLGALAALLLLYALYGWFLRPVLPATITRPDFFSGGQVPVTNHENWPRLGWYLTPLGVWLGVFGGCLLVWRVERRTALLAVIGWLFAVLYLWNISANPHHIYVMRRYVPMVAPFLLVCGSYLLGSVAEAISRQWRELPAQAGAGRAAVVVVAALWLGGIGWAARGFVSQVDHAGLLTQLDALAGRLPAGVVLLFDDQSPVGQGDIWGTPLRFIYGFDAFALRQSPADVSAALVENIETWQNSGRLVVWVGDDTWPAQAGFTYRTEEVILRSERLESSYDHKPWAIVPETTVLRLNYLEAEVNGTE